MCSCRSFKQKKYFIWTNDLGFFSSFFCLILFLALIPLGIFCDDCIFYFIVLICSFVFRCDQERLHVHEDLAELQVYWVGLQDAGDRES